MEYQTCPLAEGKSSSTFDEDGGLNRNRSSDESSGRGGKKRKKTIGDTMNVSLDGHVDPQRSKLVSISRMVE